MRSVMMTVLVVLVSSVAALGQQYVPVVANQVVQQPVQQLPMVQPAPPGLLTPGTARAPYPAGA